MFLLMLRASYVIYLDILYIIYVFWVYLVMIENVYIVVYRASSNVLGFPIIKHNS